MAKSLSRDPALPAKSSSSSPSESTPNDEPSRHDETAGMGHQARRISFWTTNLIAIGFIAIVALVLGRQLTSAWRAPALPVANEVVTPSVANDAVQIEFGNSPLAITRQVHQGDAASVLIALKGLSRRVAQQTQAAAHSELPPIAPAEQRLLERLASQEPVERLANGLAVHEWSEGVPMVAVVQSLPAEPAPEFGPYVGASGPRVVTWGLAIPYGERQWRLMAFGPSANAARTNVDRLQLPLGAISVMSVGALGSDRVRVFRSAETATPDGLQFWQDHFDQTLGASETEGWSITARGRAQRYEIEQSGVPTIVTVHLSLSQASSGSSGLQGVLFCQPDNLTHR